MFVYTQKTCEKKRNYDYTASMQSSYTALHMDLHMEHHDYIMQEIEHVQVDTAAA